MKQVILSLLIVVFSFLPFTVVQAASLPPTGETSSWIYILLAVLAIAAGGWLVFSSRKKK